MSQQLKLTATFGLAVVIFLAPIKLFTQATGVAESANTPSRAPADTSGSGSSFKGTATVAPNLSMTTGTQDQTTWGGSTLLAAVKSAAYCDPGTIQVGLAAAASDSRTAKAASPATYIDSNDARFGVLTGLGPRQGSAKGGDSPPTTPHYLSFDADFFGNNSLGLGLQQTYAANYQFDFGCLWTDPDRHLFGSIGVGAGFMSQRLYKTPATLNGFVLPLSGQISYVMRNDRSKAPELVWYALLGYLPVLTNMNAYQLSGITGLQIPTGAHWLTINFSDTDLYANNAPVGHKRNYQSGTVSLVFSFPPKKTKKTPSPDQPSTGACYGGDKLQRLFCYEHATSDTCSAPNIFLEGGHCTAAGIGPFNKPRP